MRGAAEFSRPEAVTSHSARIWGKKSGCAGDLIWRGVLELSTFDSMVDPAEVL